MVAGLNPFIKKKWSIRLHCLRGWTMSLNKPSALPSSQRCPLNPAIQSKHVLSSTLHKPPRHLSGHFVELSIPYIPGSGQPNYTLNYQENINIKVSSWFNSITDFYLISSFLIWWKKNIQNIMYVCKKKIRIVERKWAMY